MISFYSKCCNPYFSTRYSTHAYSTFSARLEQYSSWGFRCIVDFTLKSIENEPQGSDIMYYVPNASDPYYHKVVTYRPIGGESWDSFFVRMQNMLSNFPFFPPEPYPTKRLINFRGYDMYLSGDYNDAKKWMDTFLDWGNMEFFDSSSYYEEVYEPLRYIANSRYYIASKYTKYYSNFLTRSTCNDSEQI